MMREIYSKAKSKSIDKKNPKDIWQLQKPHWQSHSLVASAT
ncbi:hypothetical protein ACU8V4_17760 [Pseudoalteromonas mariniglutinosa]